VVISGPATLSFVGKENGNLMVVEVVGEMGKDRRQWSEKVCIRQGSLEKEILRHTHILIHSHRMRERNFKELICVIVGANLKYVGGPVGWKFR
jgi:hypothetical protein